MANISKKERNTPKPTSMREEKKIKVQLPRDHTLLHKESYPILQKTIWTHLDNVIGVYQKIFLRDMTDINEVKELIEHYFLFIFIQTLIESKMVFDTKRPKSNPFFQQVIDDFLIYIQKKYDVSLTISSDIIKKKLFTTTDKTIKPLELTYENCIEKDLLHWENYFNTYFFTAKKTSVDHIRREVMSIRNENKHKITKSFELLNPLYHVAKDKQDKILKTIEILKAHKAEDNFIENMLNQIQETLKKVEEDIKNNVVFEEDPPLPTTPDSLVKIQQQYLKRYQVPVQYWKIFGVVINRLNNFYQIKNNLNKKAQKHNEDVFDKLITSDKTPNDIMYHLNTILTTKDVLHRFHKKWNEKQEEKTKRIQYICLGARNIATLSKKKENITRQSMLNF